MKYHTTALFLGILLLVPGLGYSENEDFTRQLNFGGYISTYLYKNNVDSGSPLAFSLSSDPSFVVSKLDTFVESKFAPNWRFFGEIEFVYTPYGYSTSTTPGSQTSSRDATNFVFQNPLTTKTQQNNGLIIQRAFVDYTVNDLLSFRVGQYLTPFGIWNEDHGDPILTSITLPYSVSTVTYAQAMAGAQTFGKWFASEAVSLSYNAYIGNGDGTQPFGANPGGTFSGGGRVQADLFDALTLNASYYYGDLSYGQAGSGKFTVTSAVNRSTYGGGLKFSLANFVLQVEEIFDDPHVVTGPTVVAPGTGTAPPNGTQSLFYAQAEYTIWDIFTPYARYERVQTTSFTGNIGAGGVNIHILPQVVFKTDGSFVNFETSTNKLQDFTRVSAGLTVLF